MKIGNKFGYINHNGKIVIDNRFDDANYFNNGLAWVKIDNKFGMIDRNGKQIIKPIYDSIDGLSEGIFVVEKNDKYGFINDKGKVIVEPKYEYAKKYQEGIAAVCVNGKYGYIDNTGKIVITPVYENAEDFNYGLAKVSFGTDKWTFIDRNDKMIAKPQFDFNEYDSIKDFSEGLMAVGVNGRWGFINRQGKFVIRPQYETAFNFSNGLAEVSKNFKTQFIDKKGRVIIKPVEFANYGLLQMAIPHVFYDSGETILAVGKGWYNPQWLIPLGATFLLEKFLVNLGLVVLIVGLSYGWLSVLGNKCLVQNAINNDKLVVNLV